MSNMTMWGVAGLCRAFLSALNSAEVHGGEAFAALLDSRQDPSQRSKGLITGTSANLFGYGHEVQLLIDSVRHSLEPYQRVRSKNIF